jgi:putative NADPH-quinone reductase
MTIYTPNKSSHLAGTKYAVFVTKNKKEYKKEYKEYNFGVQRVHRVHRVHSKICTRKKKKMYSFLLERVQSGHPDGKLRKITENYGKF